MSNDSAFDSQNILYQSTLITILHKPLGIKSMQDICEKFVNFHNCRSVKY